MTVRSPSNKIKHYRAGIWAEYLAAAYLMLKGYRIRKMRYKTRVGEIDLIASKGRALHFVEVKYRPTLNQAGEAVIPHAQSRIRRAAEHYLLGRDLESFTVSFDVIGITPNFRIRHIKNAF